MGDKGPVGSILSKNKGVADNGYTYINKSKNSTSKDLKGVLNKLIDLRNTTSKSKRLKILDEIRIHFRDITWEYDDVLGLKKSDPKRKKVAQELATARKALKDHFNIEMRRLGLQPHSYEDFEEYIVENVRNEEYLITVYLYIEGNFDTTDRNDVVKSPKDVFYSKQGECDDISFFIDHFARKKGIKHGKIVHEVFAKMKSNGLTGHVAYFIEDEQSIIMIDNDEYLKIKKDGSYMKSYKDIIHRYEDDVAKANVLDPKLCRSGKFSELDLSKGLKPADFEYDRKSYYSNR